jgi:stringent starvation protein B
MSNPPLLPAKKDVARALLLRGSVFIHLDPRLDQVVVPERLRLQPQVVLQVGLDMPVPIPDLRVDDAGIYGTLSFKGAPFTCFVPWDSVFALVGEDAKGMVWPTEVPQEIASEMRDEPRAQAALGQMTPEIPPPSGEQADVVDLFEYRLSRPRRQSSAPPPAAGGRRRQSEFPSERPAYLKVVK